MKCFICGKKWNDNRTHVEIPAKNMIDSRSLAGWVGADISLCICKECWNERTKEQ